MDKKELFKTSLLERFEVPHILAAFLMSDDGGYYTAFTPAYLRGSVCLAFDREGNRVPCGKHDALKNRILIPSRIREIPEDVQKKIAEQILEVYFDELSKLGDCFDLMLEVAHAVISEYERE